MDMCLHRGGLRYRIPHHELQRVVPAQASSYAIDHEIGLALIEGQPAIVYEPRLLSGAAERPLTPPLFYAVIGYNGDTLAAVAADRVEIATFESGNDHCLPVNLILNRSDL